MINGDKWLGKYKTLNRLCQKFCLQMSEPCRYVLVFPCGFKNKGAESSQPGSRHLRRRRYLQRVGGEISWCWGDMAWPCGLRINDPVGSMEDAGNSHFSGTVGSLISVDSRKIWRRSPWWLSGLRTWYCHSHGTGSVPGPGTSTCGP